MLNEDLCLSQWNSLRNLDAGMYGADPNDPTHAADPSVCTVRPRLITLSAGQHIYRWSDARRGSTNEEKAAGGAWWSTKRGAMHILIDRKGRGDASTSEAARSYSNVARSWGNNLDEVVCARVIDDIRCFLGMGRDITDEEHGEVWDSRGLQLYIPNLSHKDPTSGAYTLTAEASRHLSVEWVMPAAAFELEHWNANMPERSRISL
ncbi:MAG: hypothetical protein KC501_05605 [Myxococcales bacterium]|nr:hypothetical protein [Myxococcales bacterium]